MQLHKITEDEDRAVLEALQRCSIKMIDTCVYWRLSWYSDEQGENCCPSQRTLRIELGKASTETIRCALRRLEKAGLVVTTRKLCGDGRIHNSYFLPARAAAYKSWIAYHEAKGMEYDLELDLVGIRDLRGNH